MNDDLILNELTTILFKRFSNDHPAKLKIDKNYNNTYLTMACPICGDSHRDPTKKRLYVYLDSYGCKCFNCGFFGSLNSLAYKVGHKLNPLLKEKSKIVFSSKSKSDGSAKSIIAESNFDNANFSKLLYKAKQDLHLYALPITKLYLKKIENENYNNIVEFLKSRKLEYLNQDYLRCIKTTNNGVKLINTFRWENTTYVLNETFRTCVKGQNARYINTPSDYIFKNLDKLGIEVVNSYNDYLLVRNIFNIDVNDVVTVCEGFFDAGFLRNSVYLGGVNNTKHAQKVFNSIKYNTRFIFDDDSAGRKESIESVNLGWYVFNWKKYKTDIMKKHSIDISKCKDINDVIKVVSSRTTNNHSVVNDCIFEFQNIDNFTNNSLVLMQSLI